MSITLLREDITLNAKVMRQALLWFARQDEATILAIIKRKQRMFRKNGISVMTDNPFGDLLALLQAIVDSGYGDEVAFKTSKGISRSAAKEISERRKQRTVTYQARTKQNRAWVMKNLGKIAEFRRAGLSWRRVAIALLVEHGIQISHSSLAKYWKEAHDKLF